MKREQVSNVLEKVGPVHHKLAGMISNMNLAVEMFDSLSPTEQVQLNLYWQNAHQEAIQRLQESFAYLVEANATLNAQPSKVASRK